MNEPILQQPINLRHKYHRIQSTLQTKLSSEGHCNEREKNSQGIFVYDYNSNIHIINARPSSPGVGAVRITLEDMPEPEAAFTSGAAFPMVVFRQLRRLWSILDGSGTLDVLLVKSAV